MTLGANQIGAYAADLLDLEDQITALQDSKRDLYATIRDEHGKAEANALKQAVKLSRMDSEKRTERDEIDTEAQRMLAIIEKGHARRAPRAREIIEEFRSEPGAFLESDTAQSPVAADQGEGTDAPGSLATNPVANVEEEANGADAAASVDPASREVDDADRQRLAASGFTGEGEAAPAVLPTNSAADNARKIRPWCLHTDDLTKCGGYGRQHCHTCLKAHADEMGEAA